MKNPYSISAVRVFYCLRFNKATALLSPRKTYFDIILILLETVIYGVLTVAVCALSTLNTVCPLLAKTFQYSQRHAIASLQQY